MARRNREAPFKVSALDCMGDFPSNLFIMPEVRAIDAGALVKAAMLAYLGREQFSAWWGFVQTVPLHVRRSMINTGFSRGVGVRRDGLSLLNTQVAAHQLEPLPALPLWLEEHEFEAVAPGVLARVRAVRARREVVRMILQQVRAELGWPAGKVASVLSPAYRGTIRDKPWSPATMTRALASGISLKEAAFVEAWFADAVMLGSRGTGPATAGYSEDIRVINAS